MFERAGGKELPPLPVDLVLPWLCPFVSYGNHDGEEKEASVCLYVCVL